MKEQPQSEQTQRNPLVTGRPPRRPKVKTDCAILYAERPIPIMALTSRERELMRQLCSARKLDLTYYEAALTLWMRTKHEYRWCQNGTLCKCVPECKLYHFLLTALHLAIKYCGPAELEYHSTTILQGKETWTGLTHPKLFQAELLMCRQLNWLFF